MTSPKPTFKSEKQEQCFNECWEIYWRKVGRAAAEKAYAKLVDRPKIHKAIMAAIVSQSPEMLARSIDTRPHLSTWLNGKRWNDEITPREVIRTYSGEPLSYKSDEQYFLRKALENPDTPEEEKQLCMQYLQENA